MRRNAKLICLASVFCLTALVVAPAGAGGWTDAQQAVWSNVEAYWALWTKGDVEGFMGYVHDDYMGWSADSPMPESKASSAKWMSFWSADNSVPMYEITPVTVLIHGDVAVVHYYYSLVTKDKEGKLDDEQGKWTDVLVKQGDRWVLLADHGGSAPDNDD